MPELLTPSPHVAPLAQVSFASNGFTNSTDGTRIHYYTLGDGAPALVCCDGLGCDGYVWKYVVRDLSPKHRIVRWHYRAHGHSEAPKDRSRMRIRDLCDDLLAVLDAHRIERAILLGHSLGVQVILEFQRLYPDRVLGLVPVCGSYGRPLDTFHDNPVLKTIFPAISRLIFRFPEVAQRMWSTALDTEFAYQVATRTDVNGKLVRRGDFRPYLTHISRMDVRLFVTLLQDAGDHDTLEHLEKIDVPTLIMTGEKDTFTPAWLSQVMHARIKGSELCEIPGGTHTAPIEIPELVTLRLERFLEERFLSARRTTAKAG
jgi:pimeloyl-ACP methyl ester carboxylesterase